MMSNPWKKINLNDYESHMSLDNVYQLQALNEMMKEQFTTYDIESLMILGVAGGNGLEHIDNEKIKKVYGVDVNKDFLTECEKRYHFIYMPLIVWRKYITKWKKMYLRKVCRL